MVAALIALLSGFALMSLELTAVRLLAPHFGDSAYVWTNVIGVILVALAVGAWTGGLLADAGRRQALPLVLWIAGGITALVPFVATPLGGWLLPQDLPLDAAFPALVRGSLMATLVLFAPPAFCLGCVSPMLVSRLAQGRFAVGRAAGLVSAMATSGSLLGTFAATHVLVPQLGSRATVWLSAALITGCAALAQGQLRQAAAAAVPLALLAIPLGPLRGASPGNLLLAEIESGYQYLQVVRDEQSAPPATLLKINEGLDSFHSVALDGTPWTGGRYYDWHVAAPFLAGDGERPPDLRVLSLGAAAGTFARLYAAVHPGVVVDGVEIDPAVVALGERFFGGRPAPGRILAGLDARVFANRARERYDVILLDAYERQIYIPPQLASRQFFTALQGLLKPGGVVSINVGGFRFDDRVPQAIASTLASVFGEAWLFKVPQSRNLIVSARSGATMLPPRALAQVREPAPRLAEILAAMARPSAWRRAAQDGLVLDDDRPLLDELQDLSYRREHWRGPMPIAGRLGGDEADAQATAALAEGDAEAALAHVTAAGAPTARLRYLLGDARWLLRDLAGARAEYEAASALPGAAGLRSVLAARLAAVGEELASTERAADIARRNGTLAMVALLPLGLVVAGLLLRLRRDRAAADSSAAAAGV